MFAVVKISGKQYKVSEGSTIVVDAILGKPGDSMTVSDVLVVKTDKTVKVGTPYVAGAKVLAAIVSQEKGTKISVRRFTAKSRHRRSIGFRPLQTTLTIKSIQTK